MKKKKMITRIKIEWNNQFAYQNKEIKTWNYILDSKGVMKSFYNVEEKNWRLGAVQHSLVIKTKMLNCSSVLFFSVSFYVRGRPKVWVTPWIEIVWNNYHSEFHPVEEEGGTSWNVSASESTPPKSGTYPYQMPTPCPLRSVKWGEQNFSSFFFKLPKILLGTKVEFATRRSPPAPIERFALFIRFQRKKRIVKKVKDREEKIKILTVGCIV